jgi:hypothetical protein
MWVLGVDVGIRNLGLGLFELHVEQDHQGERVCVASKSVVHHIEDFDFLVENSCHVKNCRTVDSDRLFDMLVQSLMKRLSLLQHAKRSTSGSTSETARVYGVDAVIVERQPRCGSKLAAAAHVISTFYKTIFATLQLHGLAVEEPALMTPEPMVIEANAVNEDEDDEDEVVDLTGLETTKRRAEEDLAAPSKRHKSYQAAKSLLPKVLVSQASTKFCVRCDQAPAEQQAPSRVLMRLNNLTDTTVKREDSSGPKAKVSKNKRRGKIPSHASGNHAENKKISQRYGDMFLKDSQFTSTKAKDDYFNSKRRHDMTDTLLLAMYHVLTTR